MELKLGTQVPDWARDRAAGRFEGDEEEIQVPRLVKVEKMSQLDESLGAKLGDLFSDPHQVVVGGGDLRVCFVPLKARRCYKFFHGGGLLWSVDTKQEAQNQVWFTSDDKDRSNPIQVLDDEWKFKTWEFLIYGPVGWMVEDKFVSKPPQGVKLSEGFPAEPMVASFSGTSAAPGRKLWDSLKGITFHAQVIELWTTKEKNDAGQAYSVLHGRRVFTLQDKKQVEAFAGQVTESAALLERGNQAQLPAQVGGGEGEDDIPF